MQGVGDDVLDALVVLGGVPLERPPDVGGEAAVKTAPAPPPRPGPPAPGWRRCGRPRLRGAGGRREQVRHEASRGLLEQSGGDVVVDLSLIHISEPTRLGMISYAVFCL